MRKCLVTTSPCILLIGYFLYGVAGRGSGGPGLHDPGRLQGSDVARRRAARQESKQ
jgi:hypothetical protein